MNTKDTNNERCVNCKYFFSDARNECRRYPMRLFYIEKDLNEHWVSRWPNVHDNHWCGEFKAKTGEEE